MNLFFNISLWVYSIYSLYGYVMATAVAQITIEFIVSSALDGPFCRPLKKKIDGCFTQMSSEW